MARLIYSMFMSLDGFVADQNGNFDWATPDEEVHAFANGLERSTGMALYGRRMYEVMGAWESMGTRDDPAEIREFAELWRATDKVVYSRTLSAVTTSRTRLERAFEPEVVQRLKSTAERDISISGAGIAAEALKAGLVDACYFFVVPILVGSGTRALPSEVRLSLELVDVRRFGNGMVFLNYATAPG